MGGDEYSSLRLISCLQTGFKFVWQSSTYIQRLNVYIVVMIFHFFPLLTPWIKHYANVHYTPPLNSVKIYVNIKMFFAYWYTVEQIKDVHLGCMYITNLDCIADADIGHWHAATHAVRQACNESTVENMQSSVQLLKLLHACISRLPQYVQVYIVHAQICLCRICTIYCFCPLRMFKLPR